MLWKTVLLLDKSHTLKKNKLWTDILCIRNVYLCLFQLDNLMLNLTRSSLGPAKKISELKSDFPILFWCIHSFFSLKFCHLSSMKNLLKTSLILRQLSPNFRHNPSFLVLLFVSVIWKQLAKNNMWDQDQKIKRKKEKGMIALRIVFNYFYQKKQKWQKRYLFSEGLRHKVVNEGVDGGVNVAHGVANHHCMGQKLIQEFFDSYRDKLQQMSTKIFLNVNIKRPCPEKC